jgi:hypothetical protein
MAPRTLPTRFAPRRLPARRLGSATAAIIAGLVALLMSAPAAAQPSLFHSVQVQALDARSLFEPLRQTAVQHGAALKLVPRQQAAARDQFTRGFQVRVFRVTGPATRPEVLAEFEPCLVYLGTLFQFRGRSDLDEVSLGRLTDLGWLSLQSGHAPEKGQFLLVAEPLGERHDLLRIEKGLAMQKYFASGLYFEVVPEGSIAESVVKRELDAARQRWRVILASARQNDASLDCVRTAEFASPDAPAWLADAEVCGGIRPTSNPAPDGSPSLAAPAQPA